MSENDTIISIWMVKIVNKRTIPNLLTLTRIVFTPIIILLGLLGKTNIVIFLAIICALTDMFDGKLARKWNVVSKKGAQLDALADKVFAIGLLLSLVTIKSNLLLVLILEIIIGITNLYYFYIINKTESLIIGKIKTTTLFMVIISCMLGVYFSKIHLITTGLIYATMNLQILCLIFYYKQFLNDKVLMNTSVENTIVHKKIMDDVEVNNEETMEVTNLIELAKKYNLYDKEDH